ncbi:hypothetical protein HELRODRAFT_175332 [Helobdella robusta]|uniref:Apple domain-containing protein n=1 Tax=Helobdella robusta TaxID=6412 RepID=T1F955_HELRO|nr:hypothetical protein HELRODRAFT_175332 [Helobdella robusta]ESO00839.1 hypothetical protein HELRODRAFT_175332 [Helobdella robusta]
MNIKCLKFFKYCQTNLTNIALGAFTYNSSSYKVDYRLWQTSYFAVDGKNGLIDTTVLCSLTVPGFEPHWIGVDLGNLFNVVYTIVYAGTNKSSLPKWNDLNFFIVGVSNRSLDVHPPVRGTYDLCAQYPGVVVSKQVVQLNCSSTTPPARYVILQQPSNSTGYMSVCEWEIYGIPYGKHRTNLLLKKPAKNSSNSVIPCGPQSANLAVDGFHDTFPYNCHCGHTNDAPGGPNWFRFDMQADYFIDYIVLTSRAWEDPPSNNDAYARRLENFIIGLADTPLTPVRQTYPMCATWPGYVKVGVKVQMKCNANLPDYRYLIAQGGTGPFNSQFTICELEAYEAVDRMVYRKKYGNNFSNTLAKFVWKRQASVRLNGFQFNQLYVRSASECVSKSQQLGGCDSINFHPASKLCQFNSHINGYTSITADTNWSFYVMNYN